MKKKKADRKTEKAKKTLEKIINRLTVIVLIAVEKERERMFDELQNL